MVVLVLMSIFLIHVLIIKINEMKIGLIVTSSIFDVSYEFNFAIIKKEENVENIF